jgi:hypothetical protein
LIVNLKSSSYNNDNRIEKKEAALMFHFLFGSKYAIEKTERKLARLRRTLKF